MSETGSTVNQVDVRAVEEDVLVASPDGTVTCDEQLLSLVERLRTSAETPYEKQDKVCSQLRENPFKTHLYQVLCERKEYIALHMRDSDTSNGDSQFSSGLKIDTMLKECFEGAEMGPPSPDADRATPIDENKYKRQFSDIRKRHDNLMGEVERIKKLAEERMNACMTNQREFRPITKIDHENALETVHARYGPIEQMIKKDTCNEIMLLNSKCLDARRRRRNFSKETTAILMDFFNAHETHPYPNEDEKQMLAARCGMTVQQVSNWFGNRRIRMKKQAVRPLQPPSTMYRPTQADLFNHNPTKQHGNFGVPELRDLVHNPHAAMVQPYVPNNLGYLQSQMHLPGPIAIPMDSMGQDSRPFHTNTIQFAPGRGQHTGQPASSKEGDELSQISAIVRSSIDLSSASKGTGADI